MADGREEPSIMSQLQPFTWSTAESVAYEAAVEAISEAVGAYSALIAAEEARADPDLQLVARAQAGQAECARRREELDPVDHKAVAQARQRFAALARQIREGRA
jgi:hypothetical protein